MNNDSKIVFNKTVQGYSHKKRDIICQDYSKALDLSSVEPGCYFAAVADGHGDKTCIRSNIGSMYAVDSSVFYMQRFIDLCKRNGGSYKYFLDNGDQAVKHITDSIILSWHEKIREDFNTRPLTEHERNVSGDYLKFYESGDEFEHAYGTTLIIAMLTEDYLLCIHHGDGRCIVFWEDGTCEQPVAWDKECVGNTTSSLCDADAAERIRHSFIRLDGRKPLGIFLMSDGVEDAFTDADMEGTYAFIKSLIVNELAEGNRSVVEARIEELLPEFSEKGSGDDISIAGIVDREMISSVKDEFAGAMDSYLTGQKIADLKNRLPAMEHMDAAKKQKIDTADGDEQRQLFTDEYEQYHNEYMQKKNELDELLSKAKEEKQEV